MEQTFKEVQGEWAIKKYKSLMHSNDLLKIKYKDLEEKYHKLKGELLYTNSMLKSYEEIIENYKETTQNLTKLLDKK